MFLKSRICNVGEWKSDCATAAASAQWHSHFATRLSFPSLFIQLTSAATQFMDASISPKQRPAPSLAHAQKLHLQRDKLTQLKHALKSNHHVIKSMKEGFERLRDEGSEPLFWDEAAFKKFSASLDDHHNAIQHHEERVDSIDRRCNNLSGLVSLRPDPLPSRGTD
jgi:Mg2+ and Co2+ transporter CorA